MRPDTASRLRTGVRVLALTFALAAFSSVALAQETKAAKDLPWFEIALTLIGGLMIFLYGVNQLAARLKEVSGDRLRKVLHTGSSDRARGVVSGTVVTVLLDSSSAVIILVIALVDANLIRFSAALPVILGSNIGTTFSSQIFALNADSLAPILMAFGFLSALLARGEAMKQGSWIAFFIGLMLFGLSVVGMAVEPLKEAPEIKDWLSRFEAPLLGVLAGAAATAALQSSSAVMGMIIVLASQGLISLPAGLALVLGAEIGTCADTLVATIGRSRAALRAGVFHLLFNIVSVTAGLALLGVLTRLATASASSVEQQVANAHMAFNVTGALIFLAFTPWIAKALDRLIPDGASDEAKALKTA